MRHERDTELNEMANEKTQTGLLLYGVKAIADFLGVRQRQALGLIERGHLPHYHVGKIVCANRATLTAWLAAREAEAMKPKASTNG